ncbi:hypothetical protein QBC32DRAFT_318274 [Pseudoneurospora amorphoporcata]|uniref:Uncharacterized protein n=1 Tax=Pseudoneurospora amorphoporcata TaxID=241081 RepID=A0AAN6SCC6_9PEZI|nr:hypothetical protein QBC32DRAFT_318274 [Pseudoneurospora amorphoporcata]
MITAQTLAGCIPSKSLLNNSHPHRQIQILHDSKHRGIEDTSTVAAGATVSHVLSTEQEALSSASSSAHSGSSAATRALPLFWVINIPEHSIVILGIEESPKEARFGGAPA